MKSIERLKYNEKGDSSPEIDGYAVGLQFFHTVPYVCEIISQLYEIHIVLSVMNLGLGIQLADEYPKDVWS